MKIGNFEIGKHGIYTIAEIGKNHNGHMSIAKKLIEVAHTAGCHAVKFQAYHTEHLLHTYSKSGAEPDLEWLRRCEFRATQFVELKKFCDKVGIVFLATPENEVYINVLVHACNVPAFKISSLNINNYRMLDKIAKKSLPVILSTGMSSMREVDIAMSSFHNGFVALLHCVSQYPARLDSLNLKAMDSMRKEFGVPVGFSDHTMKGVGSKLAACAGAELLEFHITLDHGMEGPDHTFSLDPKQLKCMTTTLWEIQRILGDGIKQPHTSEGKYVEQKRRCCVAYRDIRKGDVIKIEDIICLAPGIDGAVSAAEIYKITSGIYASTVEIPTGRPIFEKEIERV
ncbi:MAG: N-acetylneuraminate synthase family protein [Candidatus Hodarchaeales archaeon]|jgi:sialic acid synthase SpsE